MSEHETIADDQIVRPAPDAAAKAGGYYSAALARAKERDGDEATRLHHLAATIAHLLALEPEALARTHVLDDGVRVMIYSTPIRGCRDERGTCRDSVPARAWLDEVAP